MERKITPNKVRKLWEKMGSRNALADHLNVSENTIRRWDDGRVDVNKSGYRFEINRLMFEKGIV